MRNRFYAFRRLNDDLWYVKRRSVINEVRAFHPSRRAFAGGLKSAHGLLIKFVPSPVGGVALKQLANTKFVFGITQQCTCADKSELWKKKKRVRKK